jgi:hypothetical protein
MYAMQKPNKNIAHSDRGDTFDEESKIARKFSATRLGTWLSMVVDCGRWLACWDVGS